MAEGIVDSFSISTPGAKNSENIFNMETQAIPQSRPKLGNSSIWNAHYL